MKVKKIIIAVICLAILLIPTYVAIASYKQAQKSPVTDTSVTEVTIVDPNGKKTKLLDPDVFSMFVDMSTLGKSMSEMPDEMKSVDPCTVSYKCTNGNTYEYKYYFTQTPEECVFTDYKDKVFRVSANEAEKFLMSEYSEYLYTGAKVPSLTVNNTTILPGTMNWTYLSYGDAAHSVESATSDEKKLISTTKGFTLDFDVSPDIVTVYIYENGKEIYNGLYEDMASSFSFREDSNLSVKTSVKWNEDRVSRRSFGTAEYNFEVSVLPAPIFTLGEQQITNGEFVTITAENVVDTKDIVFLSEPSINFTPVFTELDGYAVALVPISCELPFCDEYKFTITYGDVTQVLKLKVAEKNYKTVKLPTAAATLNAYRTTTAMNEYNQILDNYLKSSSTSKYFSGSFGEGTTKSLTILMGFGLNVDLETGGSYRNDGVDFGYSNEKDTAAAVNAGTVVYTGNLTYPGNIVIIDHGLGLMSAYSHLASINVSVGQTVERGDTIGVIGKTGCTDINRVHVGLYVYGVPVQPYTLWADGDDKEVKIYVPGAQNTTDDITETSDAE